MKISELPRLDEARRDAEIPVAVEGENFNITIGQILDSSSSIVRFNSVVNEIDGVVINGAPPSGASVTAVVYDKQSQRFCCVATVGNAEVYYKDWNGRGNFYGDDGTIRRDCLFALNSGSIYIAHNNVLKSAGITDEQVKRIRHATPIEVASEEEMQQRIESGEYEEGQLYFLAES